MASATITSKGRITIPLRAREKLGVNPGGRIEFVEVGEGKFQLMPRTRSIKELEGRYKGKVSRPVSIKNMNAAIVRRVAGR